MTTPVHARKIISGYSLGAGKSATLLYDMYGNIYTGPVGGVGPPPLPWAGKSYLIDITPLGPAGDTSLGDLTFELSHQVRRLTGVPAKNQPQTVDLTYRVEFTVTNKATFAGNFDVHLIEVG
jgi:hypothetical protein